MKLTVLFDARSKFWVGVVEQEENGRLKACRHIFGREPLDAEVLVFVRQHMMPLIARTKASAACKPPRSFRENPKRRARQAAKELAQRGMTTYAEEAIKLEYERRKQQRNDQTRQRNLESSERKYQLKVLKSKQKHKGR